VRNKEWRDRLLVYNGLLVYTIKERQGISGIKVLLDLYYKRKAGHLRDKGFTMEE